MAKGTHWGLYALLAAMALAGLHAAAVRVHCYLWHDGVLGRMLPVARVAGPALPGR